MKTNRLLTRDQAAQLDLKARIRLEGELTDADEARAQSRLLTAEDFANYRDRSPWTRSLFSFLGSLENQTVLDLGCGYNPTPIYFALAGAKKVYACDVSPRAVAYVNTLAEKLRLSGRVAAFVAAGEALPLANSTIDLVHGEGVLHHLVLPMAGSEIARILKQGGRAGFKDPLGENPVLEFARDYLPYQWRPAHKGTDRPLKFRDLETFATHFSSCVYTGFGLFSTVAIYVFGRRPSRPRRIADALDHAVLSSLPFLRRYCRFVVTCAQKV